MAKKIYEACRRLLTICSNCQPEENIRIVMDTDSLEIGMALWDAAIFDYLFGKKITEADKEACIEELCSYLGVESPLNR